MNNLSEVKIPRMRTVKEAYEEIKAADNNTAMSQNHIRQLALSGVIPRIKAGRKYLINLDTLIEYMENPTADKFKANTDRYNGIRRIV